MHEFYLRLNFDERQAYLNAMLEEESNESNVESDSEDEDWFPDNTPASDSDEITDNIGNL